MSTEKLIFEVKPNLLINLIITFLKLLIPALLIVGLLYFFDVSNIIKNNSIFKFFIAGIVFLFTFLMLFLILYEQNKKLKFFEGGVDYSDLFDTKEITRMDIKDINYKKGFVNSFILEKKDNENKIIINFVDIDKDFEKIKNKILKKETIIKKMKPKSKKMSFNQIKRKHRIDDIVSGKINVTVKHPKRKRNRYLDLSEKKKKYVDVKNIRFRTDKDFIEVGTKKGKRKNVFKNLKTIKEKPKSPFKKVKELKK